MSATRFHVLLLLAASMLLGAPNAQTPHRPTISFTKVADTSTPAPGGTALFSAFYDFRDFDGASVAFVAALSDGRTGVFTFHDGILRRVVDSTTVVPGAGVPFATFFDVAVQGRTVVFSAGWNGGTASGCAFSPNEGIFMTGRGGGPIVPLIDSNSSALTCFQGLELDGGRLYFTGGNLAVDGFHNHQAGVHEWLAPGVFSTLVDTSTVVPGGGRTFVGFDQKILGREGTLGFAEVVPNSVPPLMGGYVYDGMTRTLADGTTSVPGGSGTFAELRGFNWDGRMGAFRGVDASGGTGLFVGSAPGDLEAVVRTADPVPGTPFGFLGFSNPVAFDEGRLAFTGYWGGGGQGLFVWERGRPRLRSILRRGQAFAGSTVEQAFVNAGQLVGARMLVRVVFAGFSASGLWLVHLPGPDLVH